MCFEKMVELRGHEGLSLVFKGCQHVVGMKGRGGVAGGCRLCVLPSVTLIYRPWVRGLLQSCGAFGRAVFGPQNSRGCSPSHAFSELKSVAEFSGHVGCGTWGSGRRSGACGGEGRDASGTHLLHAIVGHMMLMGREMHIIPTCLQFPNK